jgi:hypothetical protein
MIWRRVLPTAMFVSTTLNAATTSSTSPVASPFASS